MVLEYNLNKMIFWNMIKIVLQKKTVASKVEVTPPFVSREGHENMIYLCNRKRLFAYVYTRHWL